MPIEKVNHKSDRVYSDLIIHSQFGHHRLLLRSRAAGIESQQVNDQNTSKDSPRPSEAGQVSRSTNAEMQLSRAEQQQVQELRVRDSAVRAHEQAHLAAAGRFATGGPSFQYRRGPDGRHYAISGEVKIDTTPVPGDPLATQQKALKIQQAAFAPAEPSVQDRAVAAQAARMAIEARMELKQSDTENCAQEASLDKSRIDRESNESLKPDRDDDFSTCSICGGNHGADTHSALQAYASQKSSEPPPNIGARITRDT